MRIVRAFLFVTIAFLVVGATGALADTFSSELNVGNSAISGYAGPYGTVGVNLTSSTSATIVFTAADGFQFGGANIVDANINAASWSISGLTGTPISGFSGPQLSNTGSGTVDGFGVLNQTFKEFDGYGYSLKTVSFTVTDLSGTWASAANVLTGNAGGFDAGAHVFACSADPCLAPSNGGSALATGFAAEGPVSTPEPASLTLLAFGLVGVPFLRRRRK